MLADARGVRKFWVIAGGDQKSRFLRFSTLIDTPEWIDLFAEHDNDLTRVRMLWHGGGGPNTTTTDLGLEGFFASLGFAY